MGADLFKVSAVVANRGYLPTNLSDVAIENKVAKPVTITLDLENATLIINPQTQDLGNLAGRNERKFAYSNWGPQWSPTAKPVEWLVKATGPGARVTAVAASQKGGTDRVTLDLA